MDKSVFQQAFQLHQSGKLPEAEILYRKILGTTPDHADTLHLLGLARHQQGDHPAAIQLIRDAIRANDQVALYHGNLATVLDTSGDRQEAIHVAETAFGMKPSAEHACQLGQLWIDDGRPDDAAKLMRDTCERLGDHAGVYRTLGLALIATGEPPVHAVEAFQHATALRPTAMHFNDLGVALRSANRIPEAAEAFEQALARQPDHAGAANNLSVAYKKMGRLSDALALSKRAIDSNSNQAEAHCNRGIVQTEIGHVESALASFGEALTQNPDYARAHSRMLFSMQYLPGITADKLLTAHRDYDQKHTAKLPPVERPAAIKESDRISVGFLSEGFAGHPVGYFMAGLLAHIDRSQFQVTCYSDRSLQDDVSQHLQDHCDRWRKVSHQTNSQLAQQIVSDQNDILFDLSGHVGGSRLEIFARRVAPLQITWMGYVGTTGLSAMDALLADANHVPVGTEQQYVERVLRMPVDYVCFAPRADAPPTGTVPSLENGFVTFGCFNQPAKLNEAVLRRWAAIMRRVPGSHLLLKYRGFDDPGVIDWVHTTLLRHGIKSDRVEMQGKSPQLQFLETYQRVDVALDTTPYSGGVTTCDALWMGVPVVTVPGQTFAGRHSTSHLRAVGLDDFVAGTDADYEEIAVELANDVERRINFRQTLRERMLASPLVDAKRFATDWCKLMTDTWEQTPTRST